MPKEPFSAEELARLDSIHDDPRNDGPRLAYADWLDTQGQPELAEFIRLQCQQPYFALVKQGNEEPRVSHDTFEIKSYDPDRANRAIELLGSLHQSDRFPDVNLWQDYVRGLPLYEAEVNDWSLEYSVTDFCQAESPLARYRLLLRTGRLADWLAHPIMRFVDVLRIFPGVSQGVTLRPSSPKPTSTCWSSFRSSAALRNSACAALHPRMQHGWPRSAWSRMFRSATTTDPALGSADFFPLDIWFP